MVEVEEIFAEMKKNMECTQVVTIGHKDTYKEGELKKEFYYLTFFNKAGVRCTMNFTKTYDLSE
jgi:hypothetical protein